MLHFSTKVKSGGDERQGGKQEFTFSYITEFNSPNKPVKPILILKVRNGLRNLHHLPKLGNTKDESQNEACFQSPAD